MRDLRVYCQPLHATISHYRDNTGLEVDTILQRRNGDWIAIEIKLGGRFAIDAAASSLHKLRNRIDTSEAGQPKRLIVLTATGYAYERTDRVTVVPHHSPRTLISPPALAGSPANASNVP